MSTLDLRSLVRSACRLRVITGVLAACVSGTLWLGSAVAVAGSGLVTRTFTASGESSFVVPTGDASVLVTATGAAGAARYSSCGGFGAVVKATLAVTPGKTVYVEVGGVGANGGGVGGGGAGAGGGESDVRTLPEAQGLVSTESRLLVAGGGGGGGDGTESGLTGCGGSAGIVPARSAGMERGGPSTRRRPRRTGPVCPACPAHLIRHARRLARS